MFKWLNNISGKLHNNWLVKEGGLILLLITSYVSLLTGQIPVGTWRDHLSWNTAEAVTIAGDKVYCSNGVGICIYDIQSRNLDKLTKVNGLNDAGITALRYAASTNIVIVGYTNGNLDIVAGNDVYNIPDIKRSSIYTNKQINHIYESGKYAYLSCSFGIVVVDIQLRQIRDTYIIGDGGVPVEVFALTEYNGYFYASTAQGLKYADNQSRLLTDFSVWKKVNNIPSASTGFTQVVSSDKFLYVCDMDDHIFLYDGVTWNPLMLPFAVEKIHRLSIAGGSLLVSTSGAVFIYNAGTSLWQNTIKSYNDTPVVAYDATLDVGGACWIADNKQGLVQWKSASAMSYHLPNGPASNHAGALRFKADRLLVASGGKDADNKPLNRKGEIHTLYANQWNSISLQGAYDFTDVDISMGQPGIYYVSSWGEGMYIFENGILKTRYTQNNSTLTADHSGSVYCGGVFIDTDNKLWVSNDTHASLLSSGQWKALPWQTLSNMGRFTEDTYQHIWTPLYNNGLWVFDKSVSEQGQSGGTIRFYPYNYTGTLPISQSNQIVTAPDGIVWVGTTQGPVYYSSSTTATILEGNNTKGFHPIRTEYALLGSENILSVAVDGAYRKWFGTATGGVFLIDEDNAGEVKHFTVDNSPLFSNKVHDIAINDKTGEVFFATEYGIVAYRGDAVSSGDDFGKVYVFPNPVRPEFQGEITITGLIKDADVKITDTAGNLVYQTRTLGGQAVWNGRNQQGRRVATGVYLVFCTNDDGSKTHITKLLFIH